jgi:RNA polymerase sigma-70 factor (ECF subfamily)
MGERSDEDLMRQWAAGKMEAFEMLYSRYRAPLYRYVLRMVGDEATANDLYQGSWEKIIRARRRYRPTAPFRAWMYRIAHNHVMDHFRRVRPEGDLPPTELVSDLMGPDEQLAMESRNLDLQAAIDSLPTEQKDTLLLKLESGLDLHTIAEVTGVNPETAKSRLRYAVKRLKQVLGDQGLKKG